MQRPQPQAMRQEVDAGLPAQELSRALHYGSMGHLRRGAWDAGRLGAALGTLLQAK